MAIYSGGFNTAIGTTTAPSADIKASSSNSPRLMEWAVNIGAATASRYGIGRPANDGSVVQTGTTALQAENPADPPSQTTTATTWTTAPTVPGVFMRQVWTNNVAGAGVIWTFPRGLAIPVSKGIVQWNIAANAANCGYWVVVDE